MRRQSSWVYKDLRSGNHWVWVAVEQVQAKLREAASGLFSSLFPKDVSLAMIAAEGLRAKCHGECGASGVARGGHLRLTGLSGAQGYQPLGAGPCGAKTIAYAKKAMLDPPPRRRGEADAVEWLAGRCVVQGASSKSVKEAKSMAFGQNGNIQRMFWRGSRSHQGSYPVAVGIVNLGSVQKGFRSDDVAVRFSERAGARWAFKLKLLG